MAGATACGVSGPAARTPAIFPIPPAFSVDTLRTTATGPGVTHHFLWSRTGPWAAHILDVDRARCEVPRAIKHGDGAVGRERTSTLLETLGRTMTVAGGVNADFFLFTPPGVPVGAHVSRGRVIAGPIDRPVLAFDSAGRHHLGPLQTRGTLRFDSATLPIRGWNRAVDAGIAVFDRGWGATTDTASGRVEIAIDGAGRATAIDTTRAGVAIPSDGRVLTIGRTAPASVRQWALALRSGTVVDLDGPSIAPFHPLEAVGGLPLLARDSVVLGVVDSVGGPGFATGRHPRTAVGFSRDGRRMFLVVVDGRRAPYSDGMTLRELANLMLAIGARDAINLDGGGSTAMVVSTDSSGERRLRVVNTVSDAAGERPVGNALAVVGCR